MMNRWWILLAISGTFAASNSTKCTEQKGVCNRYTPCCNTSGWCGKGFPYCGQSCHEAGNYGDVKCFPKAPCKGGEYTFNNSRIISNDDYGKVGDFKSFDFRVHGNYSVEDSVEGSELVLAMSSPNAGASISSTRYVDFGRISAVMKTSRGKGVVSSFITMSDTKDEIDFEWLGKDTKQFQSNWFQEGKFPEWPNTHGQVHSQVDSFNDYNTYTIDWSPERIIWLVNGKAVREYSGAEYPKTPSLYSFGIWDGGSGSEGTRDWAGGYVDWDSPDMKADGQYSVRIKSISVECFSEPTVKDEDFVRVKSGLVPKKDLSMYSGSHPAHNLQNLLLLIPILLALK